MQASSGDWTPDFFKYLEAKWELQPLGLQEENRKRDKEQGRTLVLSRDFGSFLDHLRHGSLNVPIEHHPTIRYMVYNGYYKMMSNIPKMGQLPTPVRFLWNDLQVPGTSTQHAFHRRLDQLDSQQPWMAAWQNVSRHTQYVSCGQYSWLITINRG